MPDGESPRGGIGRPGLRRLAFRVVRRLGRRQELDLEPLDPRALDLEHREAQAVGRTSSPGSAARPIRSKT